MNPGFRSPTRKRLGTAINEVSTIERDSVVGLSNQRRTQNGHIRNDTRDASRRIFQRPGQSDLQEKLCRE